MTTVYTKRNRVVLFVDSIEDALDITEYVTQIQATALDDRAGVLYHNAEVRITISATPALLEFLAGIVTCVGDEIPGDLPEKKIPDSNRTALIELD